MVPAQHERACRSQQSHRHCLALLQHLEHLPPAILLLNPAHVASASSPNLHGTTHHATRILPTRMGCMHMCPGWLQVVANVALRLIEFHAAGFCHRDLKPANVMWLPRENRWTVIDFGCAAKNGEQAPLSFTLVYAAPEVVSAVRSKHKYIRADPALDAWALGVMAFELLTGEPAFHVLSDGKDEVRLLRSGPLLRARSSVPPPSTPPCSTAVLRWFDYACCGSHDTSPLHDDAQACR